MTILLTGATGFIGSHVARWLVQRGHDVHALVRPGADLGRLSDLLPRLRLTRCDLLQDQQLEASIRDARPELCIHAAWYAVPGHYLGAVENLALLNASLRLAWTLAGAGCRRFVGIGTCFEYDTTLGYLSESTPTRPLSLYAASKLSLHMLLDQIGSSTGMEVGWARLFYQYGPYEHPARLVPSVIRALLAGRRAEVTRGEQIRDFLHVEDVAAAIGAVAESSLSGPVNIGSGRPVAVGDIVRRLGEIVGRPELVALGALPDRPADPPFVCANNQRLERETSWVPRYDLEHGLALTVDWWRTRADALHHA